MVVRAFNPRNWEAKAGGSFELEVSLSTSRFQDRETCQKKKNTQRGFMAAGLELLSCLSHAGVITVLQIQLTPYFACHLFN